MRIVKTNIDGHKAISLIYGKKEERLPKNATEPIQQQEEVASKAASAAAKAYAMPAVKQSEESKYADISDEELMARDEELSATIRKGGKEEEWDKAIDESLEIAAEMASRGYHSLFGTYIHLEKTDLETLRNILYRLDNEPNNYKKEIKDEIALAIQKRAIEEE